MCPVHWNPDTYPSSPCANLKCHNVPSFIGNIPYGDIARFPACSLRSVSIAGEGAGDFGPASE